MSNTIDRTENARTASYRRSKRKFFAPDQSLNQATSDTLRSVSWLTDQRVCFSPSQGVSSVAAAPFSDAARNNRSPLTVAGTAAELHRIPVTEVIAPD